MAKKIRVGILFGGRSAEHEVSLQSAKNIIDAIDANKYEVALIGIDKKGQWHLNEQRQFLLPSNRIRPHSSEIEATALLDGLMPNGSTKT
jgi:D-alanine-D-alanine ligase-like ATP-grasp enzyme